MFFPMDISQKLLLTLLRTRYDPVLEPNINNSTERVVEKKLQGKDFFYLFAKWFPMYFYFFQTPFIQCSI